MSLDTPVFDEKSRDIIVQAASSFDIRDRFRKAGAFLSYLQATWYDANFDVNYFDFRSAVHDQKAGFEAVSRIVKGRGS
jgi:hypothetical protein